MIVRQDLRNWLVNRGAQRATRQGIEDFALDWRCGAVFKLFDDVMANLPEQSAEAAAEAACMLFADDHWVDALIDGLAARLRSDPFFVPPFSALNSDVHSGLVVFEDERVAISAGIAGAHQLAAKKNRRRGPTSIGFTGQVSVLKFVKAGNALLSFWEAPRITAGFTSAAAGRCVRAGERRISDGDILTVDGRHQSYIIDHARSNLFVLQATIALDQAPLSVEYDSATHEFVGCSAKDDSASRIQMMTTLLRKLECAEAFPTMATFLDHADFFVRWHVMRELLGLDAQAALPHLRRMAEHDPHADARRAAQSVLDRLRPPDPRKAA